MAVSSDLFERRFSADGVKRHKPDARRMRYVEDSGCSRRSFCSSRPIPGIRWVLSLPGGMRLLSERPGERCAGGRSAAQLIGDDLNDVADQLIARHVR